MSSKQENVNTHTHTQSRYFTESTLLYGLPLMMHLDLLGSSWFLALGERCSEELGLDSRLELGGGIGHLLLWLLTLLGGLDCHLLCANLREMKIH